MAHQSNLQLIERSHLLEAAAEIDRTGAGSTWSEYWMHIDGKEYQFKYLIRLAHAKATGKALGTEAFGSTAALRRHFEEKFGYKITFQIQGFVPFFTAEDLAIFSEYAGKPYRSNNSLHQEAGKRIQEAIFKKTNAWVRALNLDGFDVKLDNKWQISGSFKRYSWARIFRIGDKDKRIFFTVGVLEHGFVLYKLDCQRTNYGANIALAPAEVALFDQIVKPTGANWKEISSQELISEYDWERLIDVSRKFIEYYTPLYDEVIEAIYSQKTLPTSNTNTPLIQVAVPLGRHHTIPERQNRSTSVNPDYDADNHKKKKIGDAGEQLVLERERAALIEAGRPDLAEKVRKVLDWEGFDILSYYPDERVKYIEVKTTTGSADRPFVVTANEKKTMLEKAEAYHLYRLFQYNEARNTALFFELNGDFSDRVLEEALTFNVYLKG
ncbi:MAG: DUF3883 domain-containing protein [Saprospiraceae bacterium]|jgi:hypothetical protein|nr:DUF3883 domain-containing protein [Saprospiraceae bacterium]